MTDADLTAELRRKGFPDHVVRAGRKGLIARWQTFVREVERGYQLGIEDYQNDLDVRTILFDLALDGERDVAEADDRFQRQLVRTELRLWHGPQDAFWLFGRPRRLSEELREDLEARDWL